LVEAELVEAEFVEVELVVVELTEAEMIEAGDCGGSAGKVELVEQNWWRQS
jgi:hypothetical protein